MVGIVDGEVINCCGNIASDTYNDGVRAVSLDETVHVEQETSNFNVAGNKIFDFDVVEERDVEAIGDGRVFDDGGSLACFKGRYEGGGIVCIGEVTDCVGHHGVEVDCDDVGVGVNNASVGAAQHVENVVERKLSRGDGRTNIGVNAGGNVDRVLEEVPIFVTHTRGERDEGCKCQHKE